MHINIAFVFGTIHCVDMFDNVFIVGILMIDVTNSIIATRKFL